MNTEKNNNFIRYGSLIGLVIALLGMYYLYSNEYLFSKNPLSIIIQILAIILMVFARITFGIRSFHAPANITRGKLITNGVYKYFRHPIYASLIYFFSTSLISFPIKNTITPVILIIIGLSIRIFFEEQALISHYKEYKKYSEKTKRIIPFIL